MVAIRGRGGVHIHTVGLQKKCHLLQSASHGGVKCYALFRLTDFPVYAHSLWQLYCELSWVAVHIRIEGLHQSGPHSGVKCYASLRNRILRVQGSVKSPEL